MGMWLLLGSLLFASSGTLDNYLEEMQTTQEEVQQMIEVGVRVGFFTYPYACHYIPVEKRAAVVLAVGQFTKAYVESKAFLGLYEEMRQGEKPRPPQEPKAMSDQRKEEVAQARQTLAELEAQVKNAPAEARQAMRQALEASKQALAQMEKGDPSQESAADQAAQAQYKLDQEQYKQQMAEWEKQYPAGNPHPLIARRLRELLETTKDVDFTAETSGEQWKTFVNPEHEAKDRWWKLAFRAGKPAVDAARDFASKWLSELE